MALKNTRNPYTQIAKLLGLPFAKSSIYWNYADSSSMDILRDATVVRSNDRCDERAALMGRVNNYPLQGPIGSIDPKLPICAIDLHAKLNDPSCDIRERWKKTNIASWPKDMNKGCPIYKSPRRASATSARARLRADTWQMHSRRLVIMLPNLRHIRAELKVSFNELGGKDYGPTVGIFACDAEPLWRDVVLVKCADLTHF